jgi:hypothetical protein
MRTTRVMGVAVLVLLAGAAAGCGDDGDDDTTTGSGGQTPGTEASTEASAEDRQGYVDAIVAISDDDDDSLTIDHRTCVAESFVDGFGVDEIVAAGVTPDTIAEDGVDGPGDLGLEFTDDQATSFYDRLTDCMDVRGLVLDAMSDGGEMPPEAVACLDENLSDDLLERYITVGFTQGDAGFEDDPDLETELDEALTPCMALSGP